MDINVICGYMMIIIYPYITLIPIKKQSSWLNCTILVGYLIEAQEWGPKGW